MKVFAFAVLAALVSGCVSSEKLRSHAPVLTLASGKDARTVATCIAGKWGEGGAFGMTMPIAFDLIPNGYTVSYANQPTVQLMADVHRQQSGSTTNYYKVDWVAGVARFETAVRECQ